MTKSQLEQYDHFLDENDWDIYYWATQSPPTTSLETAEGSASKVPTSSPPQPGQSQETDTWRHGKPRSGEWAQTVGAFKPAYRPVPQRWKNSEILSMLRRHVREKSAGSVVNDLRGTEPQGGGLGRMPEVQVFD